MLSGKKLFKKDKIKRKTKKKISKNMKIKIKPNKNSQ